MFRDNYQSYDEFAASDEIKKRSMYEFWQRPAITWKISCETSKTEAASLFDELTNFRLPNSFLKGTANVITAIVFLVIAAIALVVASIATNSTPDQSICVSRVMCFCSTIVMWILLNPIVAYSRQSKKIGAFTYSMAGLTENTISCLENSYTRDGSLAQIATAYGKSSSPILKVSTLFMVLTAFWVLNCLMHFSFAGLDLFKDCEKSDENEETIERE